MDIFTEREKFAKLTRLEEDYQNICQKLKEDEEFDFMHEEDLNLAEELESEISDLKDELSINV